MKKDKIALQNAEFDAGRAFVSALRRCLDTPVVDDDYPQMRYHYESALRTLLEAVRANTGREVPDLYRDGSITLAMFASINRSRALRWHQNNLESWSLSDWFTALAGEVGELANVVKKLNRVRDGLQQKAVDESTLQQALADEIGDVFAYLDLFAQRAGLVLETCAREKFNRISEREGFPERL